MKRALTIRIAAAAMTIAAGAFFAFTLVHAVWYAPDGGDGPPLSIQAHMNATAATSTYPTELIIPAIGISANVQYTGVKPNGSMGTPDNFTDVAWYRYGTVPGEAGSAVIDGHVDNGLSLAGVFKRLGQLKPGDDIFVVRKDGAHLHFVITAMDTYPYEAVPTEAVFEQSDGAYLKLITCDGAWVQAGDTYDHRLVVTALLSNT